MRRVSKFFIGIVRALPFVGFVRRGDRGAAHFFFSVSVYWGHRFRSATAFVK